MPDAISRGKGERPNLSQGPRQIRPALRPSKEALSQSDLPSCMGRRSEGASSPRGGTRMLIHTGAHPNRSLVCEPSIRKALVNPYCVPPKLHRSQGRQITQLFHCLLQQLLSYNSCGKPPPAPARPPQKRSRVFIKLRQLLCSPHKPISILEKERKPSDCGPQTRGPNGWGHAEKLTTL